MKKLVFAALSTAAFTITGCCKDGETATGHYLKFTNATVHLANKKGDSNWIRIQSDLDWKLAFEKPAPDWTMITDSIGRGDTAFVITSTLDNNTGGYKFVNLVATPVGNRQLMPARITVVQYDSTRKTN